MRSTLATARRHTLLKQLRHTGVAVAALASLMTAPAATAQTSDANTALSDVVRQALATSPEVAARLNALRGAGDAIDATKGGWLPRVDLDAKIGRTQDRFINRNPANQTLNHAGIALSATQLLWDGGAIGAEASRLGHERLARWFEFVDITEQTSLEAVRAYQDVMRFRRLVSLAEDNYVQHKYVTQQMQSRATAGVGRGVDVEQANARLALAESNLTTETANLHDVTARYLRVVGDVPAAMMATPSSFDGVMPSNAQDAMDVAAKQNAAVSASIENMRAARDSISNRKAAYQPQVEARVRSGLGRNFDGIPDQRRDTSAEVGVKWNLYNGGSDQARVRQATRLMDQASDLRDKTCRDVRQTAAIAFSDVRKLTDVIGTLERNTAAIIKARDAYRQQFDIGQRNLLDVLNAENEVYTARRSVANARGDLAIAQARSLAAMQRLNTQLGIARAKDADAVAPKDAWEAGSDAPGRCPSTVAQAQGLTPRGELDARAAKLVQAAPPLQPSSVAAPAPQAAPAPAAAPMPAPKKKGMK
jgi:outer membrane protein, adhesin transport system